MSFEAALHQITSELAPVLPLPGSGHTPRRFFSLAEWSAADLSLGRLAEGHVDALAILAEAGRAPAPEAIYGVWAARRGEAGTTADRSVDGWNLQGTKPFCSGHGLINRALVTADTPDGYRLFDVSLADHVVSHCPDSWPTVGMADSLSFTLTFGGDPIPDEFAVGPAGFYLERPGFWSGAVGVAACWYGGAQGRVRSLTETWPVASADLNVAELGHALAHLGAMRSALEVAAGAIDADPNDDKGDARFRALMVRHAVHHGATHILGHVTAAAGAGPLCHDRAQSQRAADLYVYLAQHHGPQDAAEIGRSALGGPK